MNKNDINIRLERKEEYREVENLVREAFWNVYRPGCLEHYVLNQLRDDAAFVKELDFVMEMDGSLIGQNMFMKASIKADDGREIPIMTMGPICITPELKRRGYGKILLDYSLEEARKYGCGALCFEGNIDFYGKSGFTYASIKTSRTDLLNECEAVYQMMHCLYNKWKRRFTCYTTQKNRLLQLKISRWTTLLSETAQNRYL